MHAPLDRSGALLPPVKSRKALDLAWSAALTASEDLLSTTPVKWLSVVAGGKRWQVPRLLALWTVHADRRLVEPFWGSRWRSLSIVAWRQLK